MRAFILFLLFANPQQPTVEESIVVSGIRADETTPVTKSDFDRDEIARDYRQQDVPLLLTQTPSINAFTESGIGGSGYSYITLRGISPTRINFTLDGVPLADSEDMTTYFADFPDLARSLQSIQVQRGVGTSTVGSPSFGGSVNLESIALKQTRDIDATLAAGSYGQRFATIGYQSGFTPAGFALYSRLSLNRTDGYREHSGVNQNNLFLSATKQSDSAQLRFTGFTAHEKQQMSFLATDAETLARNRRDNPLSPDDRDSFGYDLANLQYLRALSTSANATASAYYQRGYGWYSIGGDRYGLDGMLLGTMLSMSWSRGAWAANGGLHVNHFKREHTLADRYSNYGTKDEANGFTKLSFDRDRWRVYGDAQLRTTRFDYHGDIAIAPIRWTFFNPRVGARYSVTPTSSVYASFGVSTREPARTDLFQGEDNASFAHDLHAVDPERVYDLEAGYEFHVKNLTLAANAYAMEFRHEIAATGELSNIGLPLRRNVDRSHRRGLELDAQWQPSSSLQLRTVANVSRNRIGEWTQFYDVYDAAGNFVDSKALVHRNVSPLLTPELMITQSVDFAPAPRWSSGVFARYVSRSFLDNTNNDAFTTPSFITIDAMLSFAVTSAARVVVSVNNVTNSERVLPSGYTYRFIDAAGSATGTSYFYPQATRNATVMLKVDL